MRICSYTSSHSPSVLSFVPWRRHDARASYRSSFRSNPRRPRARVPPSLVRRLSPHAAAVAVAANATSFLNAAISLISIANGPDANVGFSSPIPLPYFDSIT